MKPCQLKHIFWSILLGAAIADGPASILCAQDISLTFNHLPLDSRLPNSEDYFVYQDSFGFIWIGTQEGLYRFDGLNLKPIHLVEPGLPSLGVSTEVTSPCFEDWANNLWFSTSSNLMCYRRATGRVEIILDSTKQRICAFHLDAAGNLWLKADSDGQSALYLFNTWVPFLGYERRCPLRGERFSVVTDPKNGHVSKVVATMLPEAKIPEAEKTGLIVTDLAKRKSQVVNFTQPNGKPFRNRRPSKNGWVDGDSVVWVGTYNGIGKYDLKKTGRAIAHINPGPDFGWIYNVVPYDDHRLLAASELGGLQVFDTYTQKFVQHFRYRLGVPGSLPQDLITGLYRDASGNLWLSGPGMGIAFAHLRKNKFSYLPETAGILVSSLFEDRKGRIWCGSRDSGVYVFAQDRSLQWRSKVLINHDPKADPFSSLPSISGFWEDGDLWGLYENNALPWNPARRQFEFWKENLFGAHNSASDLLRANCQLADGTRLIVKGKDVFQLKTHRKRARLLPWVELSFLRLQQPTALFQSRKGYLYIADYPNRILVLNVENGKLVKKEELNDTGNCTSFAETPDGCVWAAGSKGLYCVDPALHRRLLTEKTDGLPNERYYNILSDSKGCLWLTGLNGLVRFDPGTSGKKFHRFGTADGLLSGTFSPDAALRVSSTGDIWVGGKNGLNVFRPETIHLLDDQPKIQFTGLMVNDTLFIADRDLCLLHYLDLDHTENTLSFEFAALDFSAPGHNQYYCWMSDVDEETISIGNRGFVRYANLPYGHHTFEVWATNSDGLRGTQSRRLEINISPPFWQRLWFYLLCALAIAGLLYAWFQYRLRQALKIERMRVQISSDLHDEVGVLLSGLAMQSELLERTAPEKHKSKLHRISAVSRDAMARMRDTVWAIDARRDKLEDLLDRLREQAEETLGPKGMRYEIQVEQLRLQRNLSTAVRQSLFLIYKEALTNITKHSNGDTVQISLKKWGNGLELRVCDNGTASEKAYKATGLGMSNMQMRAEKIGGVLEISREDGFCVIVRLRAFA